MAVINRLLTIIAISCLLAACGTDDPNEIRMNPSDTGSFIIQKPFPETLKDISFAAGKCLAIPWTSPAYFDVNTDIDESAKFATLTWAYHRPGLLAMATEIKGIIDLKEIKGGTTEVKTIVWQNALFGVPLKDRVKEWAYGSKDC
ncbi:MAG: hypothetical protein PW790_10660 [Parvibaculaceae bacterium]|nr:hypothetical protein [Parvibaculaceae bacterium]